MIQICPNWSNVVQYGMKFTKKMFKGSGTTKSPGLVLLTFHEDFDVPKKFNFILPIPTNFNEINQSL